MTNLDDITKIKENILNPFNKSEFLIIIVSFYKAD